MRGFLIFAMVVGLAACGSRTGLDLFGGVGTSSSGGASGGASSGAAGGSSGSSSGPTSFTGSQVSTALARCNEAHGPAVDVTNQTQESGLLEGTWLACPAALGTPTTMLSPGIALHADGTFATLAADPDGGLVVGQGVQSQGTWFTLCDTSSSIQGSQPCNDITVRLSTTAADETPGGCFGGQVSFETSPTRMYAVDDYAEWCDPSYAGGEIDLWLVPLQ